MSQDALREEMVRVCRASTERGLNRGTAGNLSVRVADGMLVTPSAVPFADLLPRQIVRMALDGTVIERASRPSTEWRLHAALLRARPEVGAVLHTHATFCTALSCLRRAIPAFHYMVAVAGGHSIRCAPYATFGSRELAAGAVEAMEGRTACLLANHGMVAMGATAAAALDLAGEVEALAAQYCRALQLGEPVLLTEAEMAEVRLAFRDYRAADGAV